MSMLEVFETTLSNGLQTTLAVSALIALIFVLRKPVARRFGAHAAYLLWALPIARLVLPPLPASWLPILPVMAWTQSSAPVVPAETAEIVPAIPSTVPTLTLDENVAIAAPPHPPVDTVLPALSMPAMNWPLILFGVWAAGAMVFFGRCLYRQWVFTRLIAAEAEAPDGPLRSLANRAATASGLTSPATVRTSLIASGPLVTGLFRPIVLLPAWFQEDYSVAEQEAALMHEMTHVRRGDLWALQIAHIALALQWFNPLAHFAIQAFRSDQEAACDADVLRSGKASPRTYGETLVKTIRSARTSARGPMAASLTLNHAIKERLILMQSPLPNLRQRLIGTVFSLGLGVLALTVTAPMVAAQDGEGLADGEEGTLKIDNEVSLLTTYIGQDRQLVILGDPFLPLRDTFKVLEDFSQFSAEGKWAFEDADFDFDFDFDVDFEDFNHLDFVDALKAVANIEVKALNDEGGLQIIIPSNAINIDAGKWDFEAFMEEISERIEAHSEVIEAIAEVHAERIAAHVERIDEVIDDRFETEIETASEIVEELAEACEDYSFSGDTVTIVREAGYSAVCVKGDRADLNADHVHEFVLSDPRLTDAEKAAFEAKRAQGFSKGDHRFILNKN